MSLRVFARGVDRGLLVPGALSTLSLAFHPTASRAVDTGDLTGLQHPSPTDTREPRRTRHSNLQLLPCIPPSKCKGFNPSASHHHSAAAPAASRCCSSAHSALCHCVLCFHPLLLAAASSAFPLPDAVPPLHLLLTRCSCASAACRHGSALASAACCRRPALSSSARRCRSPFSSSGKRRPAASSAVCCCCSSASSSACRHRSTASSVACRCPCPVSSVACRRRAAVLAVAILLHRLPRAVVLLLHSAVVLLVPCRSRSSAGCHCCFSARCRRSSGACLCRSLLSHCCCVS
jgi:hypothetical protein